ncbi:MAG: 16S rRNA (cytosine(967)-C(5))-methyltransferase RsmB, partial [Rhodocyclaceae bacterium]|nr:16S rRNA (cytosine(967)-C(5))-methyltransferase RsmB [Rhodocyclaceae bacterium]
MNHPPLSAALSAAAQAVAGVIAGRTPETVLAGIDTAVRPAALDLAFTTLRDFGRGDFLLGKLLEKPLQDNPTRALLLVALARLERRPDAAHTLVDQAVTATDKRFKGLTNAVLRNFLRQRDSLLAAADADAVAHWRHPHWWLEKLRDAYPDTGQAIAAEGNTHPPLCLRINRRRASSADFCRELAAAGIVAQALDDTAILLDKPLPVERIPGFREGRVSVQDWGAQRAADLLDAADGMRVLDACAAPGGKTAHILERAAVRLFALELDPERAARIAQNLQRLGLFATQVVGDARQPADWWDG